MFAFGSDDDDDDDIKSNSDDWSPDAESTQPTSARNWRVIIANGVERAQMMWTQRFAIIHAAFRVRTGRIKDVSCACGSEAQSRLEERAQVLLSPISTTALA